VYDRGARHSAGKIGAADRKAHHGAEHSSARQRTRIGAGA
jgi:hypothetical protein